MEGVDSNRGRQVTSSAVPRTSKGVSSDEVDASVARAWSEGRLQAPSRPGINYMLSENNRVPVGPDRVVPYRPHVMFYAPYLTNADVGGDMRGGSPVFVINEGKPGAYVIVPVPQSEGKEPSTSRSE